MELVVKSPLACSTLRIQPSDTVSSLKQRVSSTHGIPVQDQRLFLAGKELKDQKCLRQYSVTNGCTVNVQTRYMYSRGGFSLFVKSHTGETITLEANLTDTIEDIKMKLQQVVKIPALFQSLIFAGLEMSDNRTLSDFNIQMDSTLHLVIRKVVIMVEVEGGESCSLVVNSTDTVASIKAMLKEKVRTVPASQDYLLYCRRPSDSHMKLLEDKVTLAECDISKETTFEFSTSNSATSERIPELIKESTCDNCESTTKQTSQVGIATIPELPNQSFLQKFSATVQAIPIKGHQFTFSGERKDIFLLEECGIRILVPKGAIPAGSLCDLAVLPVAAGNFVFPPTHKPVSGIYAIGTSCSLLKPITIELQHCIKVTSGSSKSLTYAQAEHENVSPPYEFKVCSGGRFISGSSYCSLDCVSFTLYTVLMSIASWFISIPVERYKAHLLYEKSHTIPRKWTVHFIVTKNLNKDIELAISKVPNCTDRSEVVFSFSEPEVVLQLPKSSNVGGWDILPHQLPCKILRDDVDEVGFSNAGLPMCSIDLFAQRDCSERLHHEVNIKGVADPDLEIFLNCYLDSEDTLLRANSPCSSASSLNASMCSLEILQRSSRSNSDSLNLQFPPVISKPTLKELITHVGSAAPDKFKLIGISLGMELPYLNSLEQQHSKSTMECYAAMFDQWLKREQSQLTWETVFKALDSDIVGRPDLVKTVRTKLQNN